MHNDCNRQKKANANDKNRSTKCKKKLPAYGLCAFSHSEGLFPSNFTKAL